MYIIVTRNAKGEEIGRTYLRRDIDVTVGRAPDSTIFLTDPSVARKEGLFRIRNNQPFYIDDESAAGARINGEYLRGPTQLGPESVLEVSGFSMTVEKDPHAKPPKREAREAPVASPVAHSDDWISEASGGPVEDGLDIERMLAQRITGIRSYRDQNSEEAKARRAQIETEWKQLIKSVNAFQNKLSGDPRVHSFTVNREETEVLVKVADRFAPRGAATLIISRNHPDGKYPELDGAWLLELGKPEAHFPSPKSAMEEFVHRLAPRLV